MEPTPFLIVYLLRSTITGKTYCGYTNNPDRLSEHNRERRRLLDGSLSKKKCSGAKATKKGRPWVYVARLHGFASKEEAMACEYRWKHASTYGVRPRLLELNKMMKLPRWTKNHAGVGEGALADPIRHYKLEVEAQYAGLFDFELPNVDIEYM